MTEPMNEIEPKNLQLTGFIKSKPVQFNAGSIENLTTGDYIGLEQKNSADSLVFQLATAEGVLALGQPFAGDDGKIYFKVTEVCQ